MAFTRWIQGLFGKPSKEISDLYRATRRVQAAADKLGKSSDALGEDTLGGLVAGLRGEKPKSRKKSVKPKKVRDSKL